MRYIGSINRDFTIEKKTQSIQYKSKVEIPCFYYKLEFICIVIINKIILKFKKHNMDIVIPLKEWWNYEELRYTLRGIHNIEQFNWEVYIIWWKPNWISWIKYIEFKQEWNKYKNVGDKIDFIINSDISEDFIYMNDDMYILKPVKLEYYKTATLKDYREYLKGLKTHWQFETIIENTYNLFPDWDCFDTHTPIIYNKTKLRKLREKYDRLYSTRTLYCNEYGIKWKFLNTKNYTGNNNIKDCKIYHRKQIWISDKQIFLSSDNKAMCEEFKQLLDKYLTKSKYEKENEKEYKKELKFPIIFYNRVNKQLMFGTTRFNNWIVEIRDNENYEALKKTEDYKSWYIGIYK